MSNPVGSDLLDEAALTVLLASTAVLSGAKVGLFTNNITPAKTTLLASLVEPTYTGYARQSVSWSGIQRDPPGNICAFSGLHSFQMGDAALPTTVYGMFLAFGVTPALAFGVRFAAPRTLVDTFDSIDFVLEYIQTNLVQGSLNLLN